MACFSYIILAIFCIVAISVCGGIPRPNISRDVQKQKVSTFRRAEDAIPNEDRKSSLMTVSPTLSNTDTVNSVVRSKRSTCETPGTLPETVLELKTHLNASQVVGLNPNESTALDKTADENYTCPNTTHGSWWPQIGDNLSSTCPWTNKVVDLGPNAFPRYFKNATCMCLGCLGLPFLHCKEVTHNVTYFVRTGCENDLALMNMVQLEINVGCYCATPDPNVKNYNLDK